MVEELQIPRCLSDSIGEDNAMAILLLAMDQLTGRRALTKIGEWITRSPIHRWISLDNGKITRDFFMVALDSVSSLKGNV